MTPPLSSYIDHFNLLSESTVMTKHSCTDTGKVE